MKVCKNCKNAVDLKSKNDEVKLYACKEAFYKKTKYDSLKKMNLNSFIPVVSENETCFRFEEKEAG